MKEPIVNLLIILLRKNGIRVNEPELEFQLLSHPSYPSLHSITGVLDHFAIENYALDVPKEIETLDLLPNSFLAVVKTEEHNGFVMVSRHSLGFQLSFDGNKKRFFSKIDFLEVWTGVIVGVENDKQNLAPDVKKTNFTKCILYITIALLLIFLLYKVNLFQAIHFLLSFGGIAICVLILQHELGLHSKILDKFCSEQNKKTSCNAVLNSKGATLFRSLKFSDIGIIYFVSLTLTWFSLVNSNTNYNSIVLITLLAIPFTLFSIFYQYKIVKKWCLLCLSVVSILWLQAFSLLFIELNNTVFEFSLRSVILTAFNFLIVFALWQFISPKLKKEQELKALKIEHFKFKRNYNIFKSIIQKSDEISTSVNDRNEIVLGNNENPLLKIVVITNPLCSFCKEAHELVENLLKIEDKNIQVTIRFNVSGDYNSIDTRIALRLIEIYNKEGKQVSLKAMHDIYSTIKPNDWLNNWGEPNEQIYKETIIIAKEWCNQHSINFTPEILVNGRSFPKEYNRSDLLYFIDEIIEEEVEKVNSQISVHEEETESMQAI
ncbi:MAG: hypothetical protein HOO91_06325 [Bacteroidales bacterium]|nr:hypothetical protein [Bacteroidales bacterium]